MKSTATSVYKYTFSFYVFDVINSIYKIHYSIKNNYAISNTNYKGYSILFPDKLNIS